MSLQDIFGLLKTAHEETNVLDAGHLLNLLGGIVEQVDPKDAPEVEEAEDALRLVGLNVSTSERTADAPHFTSETEAHDATDEE